MQKPLSVQHIIAIPLQNAIFSSFSLKQWRDASTMPPSTQDPSYWEEYRAYCQTSQLPVVSYRNYLRQWSRSAREHGKGKEPKGGADGGDGKGGGPPPPPPPPLRKRQTDDTGGEAPPISKAKSGDTPSSSCISPDMARYETARQILQEFGYTAFPHLDMACGGTFADLNQHRISVPVTAALQAGLAEVPPATAAIAHELMVSFLATRKASDGSDLMERLGYPTEVEGNAGWFRFQYRSPNELEAQQVEVAYHGTHLECLHGLLATGRLLPSNDKVPGMRHFEERQGVYLHRPENKHLAEGYAAFIRYGPRHAYLRILVEAEVDPSGSLKRGKRTNQLIYKYESVRVSAFHVQIATKSELRPGDYLREWSATLEVPLATSLQAFDTLAIPMVGHLASSSSAATATVITDRRGYQGGVTPPAVLGTTGGVTPQGPSPASVDSELSVAAEGIVTWMGSPGSLGEHHSDTRDPESRYSVSVSKALAGCLRHGHLPTINVTEAGWARVQDLLSWPRIKAQHTTAADLLEIVRHNSKSRYEFGFKEEDGSYYIRAVQGHSRSDVKDDSILEVFTEETLPEILLHGTHWGLYDSIQDKGLVPQSLQTDTKGQKHKGAGKPGKEKRRHVHLISAEDRGRTGVSGFRDNATMVVAIDASAAMRAGVRFYSSSNSVVLTPDIIPPSAILHYESLRDHAKYDTRGRAI